MKKILAITALLISLLASTCFAADWYWLVSTDTASFYVDRNSGNWKGSVLNCTEKLIFTNGDYAIMDSSYNYDEYPRIFRRQNYCWAYNADGSLQESAPNYVWELVPPESNGELVSIKIYQLFEGNRHRQH